MFQKSHFWHISCIIVNKYLIEEVEYGTDTME